MIRKVIVFTPIGVGSLVAGSIARADDLGSVFVSVSKLFVVCMAGQACHVFGFYSAVYVYFTRKNPFRFFAVMPKMWITAFGTSSSAATLSTTIKTCLDAGLSEKVVNFVCPIGCTVNMDGSALERPIVILWIAYVASQPIPLGRHLVVAVICALMSIGASPIPSARVSTLLIMVEAAEVQLTPTVNMLIGFCLAIEWLLDSVRTMVNVTGDTIGVAIVDHMMSDESKEKACCSEGSIANHDLEGSWTPPSRNVREVRLGDKSPAGFSV
mmetsp:Transcript_95952/g.309449  ORF Transcript_95952/g.309449 Transcript_95952/m.309449 type:complete len:269 (-) Transcript_95952:136-942(-)